MDSCDVFGSPCYEVSWLAPTDSGVYLAPETGVEQLNTQLGAYHAFGPGWWVAGPRSTAYSCSNGCRVADAARVRTPRLTLAAHMHRSWPGWNPRSYPD
jgi:hypothetical protein